VSLNRIKIKSNMELIIYVLLFILVIMAIYCNWTRGNYSMARDENKILKDNYSKLLSQKKSSEVRLGQISENLAPFLKDFKYDPKRTHFLGNPIDYVIFEEDKVVFLEIKSGEAKLSQSQKKNKRDD